MEASYEWRPTEPLPPANGSLLPLLETVDVLRASWRGAVSEVSADFRAARVRTLRRHAIETGIIERLYDVDWGVTETLVAEGLTLEAASKNGQLDAGALRNIQAQFDGLSLLADAARDRAPLSVFFVRELHAVITRAQSSFEARDHLGRAVDAPLNHGVWKTQPNSVRRPDGSEMQYAPPAQVQSEMERLVSLYDATAEAHPLVRAAWLHHRFVLIHPFEDGNGRVARALTLLALLSSDFAPLVVPRDMRDRYIACLDEANAGDLSPLVRLFAELEIRALRSELQAPTVVPTGAPREIVRAAARRLSRDSDPERGAATEQLANAVLARMGQRLDRHARELEPEFQEIDGRARLPSVQTFAPPAEEARWWHHQVVAIAQRMDFWANTAGGIWWARLSVRNVLGQGFRFVPLVVKVGQGETGWLALIAFAERLEPSEGGAERADLLAMEATDSVTLVSHDSLERRGAEIDAFVERALSAAVVAFLHGLGG